MAAHRQDRPWTGETWARPPPPRPGLRYRLLPVPGQRARRAAHVNPRYAATFVFDNDHPCVGPDAPRELRRAAAALSRVARRRRRARRLLFAAARFDAGRDAADGDRGASSSVWRRADARAGRGGRKCARCCASRTRATSSASPIRTRTARCTRPRFVWKTIETELGASARHRAKPAAALFDRHRHAPSSSDGRRMLFEDEHAIAFVPYFARYAYEVYVAPKRRVPHVLRLNDAEAASLARALFGGDRAVRQPVADVVSLRDAAAPGANQRRPVQRVPLLHRISSAAAAAKDAEVPRGSRDWRRQIPVGHRPRRRPPS